MLLAHAPAGAVGYRLGELFRLPGRGSELWFYPPGDRASLRSDGSRILRAYFLLHPFEVPIVPLGGLYGVEYVDAQGTIFSAVPDLVTGVAVELPGYPIQIEDGEQRHLSTFRPS